MANGAVAPSSTRRVTRRGHRSRARRTGAHTVRGDKDGMGAELRRSEGFAAAEGGRARSERAARASGTTQGDVIGRIRRVGPRDLGVASPLALTGCCKPLVGCFRTL